MMRSLIVLCFVACSHPSAMTPATPVAAPPPPPPPTSQCAPVADHLISLLHAPPDKAPTMRSILVTRCDQDHWSAAAQQCFVAITTLDEGDRCEKMLTPEQAKAVERDGQAAMGGDEVPPPTSSAAPMPAPAAEEAPPAAAPASPAAKAKASKGKPSKGKPKGRSGDPCEGGE